ncbi:hypothetical protein [Proteiniborus sp. DW1]|nr:hypothetical protein [Proteiniborus sp. DW1]
MIGNIVTKDIDILGIMEGNAVSSGLVYADQEAVVICRIGKGLI